MVGGKKTNGPDIVSKEKYEKSKRKIQKDSFYTKLRFLPLDRVRG